MQVKVSKKYLDTVVSIEFDEKKLTDALLQVSLFTCKDVCGKCQNTEIALEGNKTQESYIYIKRRCMNPQCRATSTLGTYKDGSGHFWKSWEIFVPNSTMPNAPKRAESIPSPTDDYDQDLPFN